MDIAAGRGLAIPAEFAELGDLTTYAVGTRYPGTQWSVTGEDAQEAIALAERVVEWARTMVRESGAETQ